MPLALPPAIPLDAPKRKTIDWDGLKDRNEDIIGWIDIPAVEISYPLVQGDDNEFYLHRGIDKEYLFAGCLFLDSACDRELQNYNSIIYGHNMRNGSMFARLKEFLSAETVQKCPYFWIYTGEIQKVTMYDSPKEETVDLTGKKKTTTTGGGYTPGGSTSVVTPPVKTGDDTPIMLWVLLAALGLAAGGIAIFLKRKRGAA